MGGEKAPAGGVIFSSGVCVYVPMYQVSLTSNRVLTEFILGLLGKA